MTVSPARRVAYRVIREVEASDAYANLLLPVAITRAGLDARDAALATELTYGTLRRLGTYDAIIAAAAARPVARIDPPVLDALRLGVHQLMSTRIASHAAVHETVDLVRAATGDGATGFANAVLRRIARETPGDWMARITASARSMDERESLRTGHPVWILRAFRRALAAEGRGEELPALLEADNASPTVTLAALPGLSAGAGLEPTPFSPIGYRWPGSDPAAALGESGGALRVQDEGSQLAALALSRARPVRPGDRWLDLCAGPGGKTAVLAAEAWAGGAVLSANEPVPARARLVREAVAATPSRVDVTEQDGVLRARSEPGAYDRILVDAPCTGLGALRRRPEARWRKTPSDVPELARLQRSLLSAAVGALAPCGVLAYVTCSPHAAETADVVSAVRAQYRDELDELDARAVLQRIARHPMDLAVPLDGSGRAQLWPHRHGTDAMSITLLQRRG